MCATAISPGTSCTRYAPRAHGSRASLACAVRALRVDSAGPDPARALGRLFVRQASPGAAVQRTACFLCEVTSGRASRVRTWVAWARTYRRRRRRRAQRNAKSCSFSSRQTTRRCWTRSSPAPSLAVARAARWFLPECAHRPAPADPNPIRFLLRGCVLCGMARSRDTTAHTFLRPQACPRRNGRGFRGTMRGVDSVRLPAPRGVVEGAHRLVGFTPGRTASSERGAGRVVAFEFDDGRSKIILSCCRWRTCSTRSKASCCSHGRAQRLDRSVHSHRRACV